MEDPDSVGPAQYDRDRIYRAVAPESLAFLDAVVVIAEAGGHGKEDRPVVSRLVEL